MATWIKAGFWENLTCKNCKGYKGWLNLDDFVKNNSGGGGAGYKVYTGLLYQPGTYDPTVTVLENTLGHDITWSMLQPGEYYGTSPVAFDPFKTALFVTPNSACSGTSYFATIDICTGVDFKTIGLYTKDSSNNYISSNIDVPTTFEIRVYP